VRDLAQVIRAHFDDRVTMFVGQLQQRQRHADVIVQIAAGADQFLGRGLAVAAGHTDDGNVELPAPFTRECRQRR
jgi:hypothetical protein